MNKINAFFLTFFFSSIVGLAQVSPDCANAIPICNNTPVNGGTSGYGIDDFNGAQTSGCLERALEGTIESNSAWYRFRTGATGQLGFNIGIDTNEDWDFALYQSNDCNNLGEPIRCNFFDNQDENAFVGVGKDPSGNELNVQYEEWLQVEPGQDYYLFINNFSNNNSGFSIQFSGHIFVTNPYDALDCSIINNLLGPPISACEGSQVDLEATTANATIYNWFIDEGSGYNPIIGQHSAQLSVTGSGMYRVEVVRPMGNIYSDVQVAFSSMPVANLVTDDASCSGLDRYDLIQKDAEVLGNQSPSEFLISYHSSLSDANAGINQLSKEFVPVQDVHVLFARITSLTNPRCFEVSNSFQLINLTTPVLDFNEEAYLCQNNSGVIIGDESPNTSYSYQWNSGETTPTISVSSEGAYTLTVTNTQGQLSCSASRTVTVSISNPPTIDAIEIEQLSNNNTIKIITDMDAGFEFRLDDLSFQDGNTFYQVTPGSHTVTVNDPNGCGMVSETVVVVGFPKFFTPNSDGANDYWRIEGVELLDSPLIHIFDRFGKLLVELDQNSRGWDGLVNGKPLPETDYWFRLTYNDSNGNLTEAKFVNNHFSLKR